MKELVCPNCGAHEMHPDGGKLLIRGKKVYRNGKWWSQCLVCAGYYDLDLVYHENWGEEKEGWFSG